MSETIEDIVREMRRRALDFKGGNLPSEAVIAAGEDMELFADRIEAAVRNSTLLCHQACSCEILAKLETENERLRALVKELADALEKTCVPDSCRNCETEYKDCTSECPNRMKRALVAKAREEVKKCK